MNSIKLGFFLAVNAIKHSSKWISVMTIAIVFILFLTIVIISGILVGLIQGSEVAYRERFAGDMSISTLEKKKHIEKALDMINILENSPYVTAVSPRYVTSGSIEANYKTRKSDDLPNKKNVSMYGIDIENEDIVTNLSGGILEGEYLEPGDEGKYILVGKNVLAKYSLVADVDSSALRDVEPGTKVRIQINKNVAIDEEGLNQGEDNNLDSFEYIVKGVVSVKAGNYSQAVFFPSTDLRKIANIDIADVDQVAVKLKSGDDSPYVVQVLKNNGYEQYAKIQTFEEGTPEFVIQMKQLFGFLGNAFGGLLLVVATITLFIVVFINALTRRRQIGILKGIGISKTTILASYIFQSLFYSMIGSFAGLFLALGVIKPFFDRHPIDFPFSDGILVADTIPTLTRVFILIIASVLAGFTASYMVVKKNTLNAILGR
jgi:putative ABC transport system permease protein